jgi:L-alanine-DL-glutamate epimerase-like enolase superfamily enzyme
MSAGTAAFRSLQPECLGPPRHPDYLADDYVTAPTDYSGGKMRISDRPGLGLEVDRDKVTAFHQAFLREGQAVSYASAAAGVIGTISRD